MTKAFFACDAQLETVLDFKLATDDRRDFFGCAPAANVVIRTRLSIDSSGANVGTILSQRRRRPAIPPPFPDNFLAIPELLERYQARLPPQVRHPFGFEAAMLAAVAGRFTSTQKRGSFPSRRHCELWTSATTESSVAFGRLFPSRTLRISLQKSSNGPEARKPLNSLPEASNCAYAQPPGGNVLVVNNGIVN